MSAKGDWHLVSCLECGETFSVPERRIRANRGKFCSRSCGVRFNQRKHGHTTKTGQSTTYVSWAQMIQRCTNPNHPKYYLYGAAGITVDDAWLDFTKFLEDMGEKPKGTSIDRIDGNKGYDPQNCRWATPKQQSSNIRTNKFHTFNGESLVLPEIARRLNVNLATLRYRVRSGWPEHRWGDPAS